MFMDEYILIKHVYAYCSTISTEVYELGLSRILMFCGASCTASRPSSAFLGVVFYKYNCNSLRHAAILCHFCITLHLTTYESAQKWWSDACWSVLISNWQLRPHVLNFIEIRRVFTFISAIAFTYSYSVSSTRRGDVFICSPNFYNRVRNRHETDRHTSSVHLLCTSLTLW